MHLSACGSSLVSYACYTNDLHSIFELDLPWTKSCLASILFTRIYKGFEPFPEYWRRDGDEADGNFLVEYLRRCLGGTGKIKARIRQLLTCEEKESEEGVREEAKSDMKGETKNDKEGEAKNDKEPSCEADRILDAMMKETHFDVKAPLSYYACTRLLGTTYLVLGDVKRVFLASSFSFKAYKEKGTLVKGLKMKRVKEDPLGVFVKVKSEGKMVPWDRGELKDRFFVVSDRYLYEWGHGGGVRRRYFDGAKKRSTLHKRTDLTNLDVNLTDIDGTTYIVLSYARAASSPHA